MTIPDQSEPRKRPGKRSRSLFERDYTLPPPIRRIQRTYSTKKKRQVLLFLVNHLIPLQINLFGQYIHIKGRSLQGIPTPPTGYRHPTLVEAATYYGIASARTISGWWSTQEALFNPKRKDYSPRWPELEAKLWDLFIEARGKRRIVTQHWFRRTSIALFSELYPDCSQLFVFSTGWFRGFLNRHSIVRRRLTKQASKTPE